MRSPGASKGTVAAGLLGALVSLTLQAASASAAEGPAPRSPGVVHAADRSYIADGRGREMLLRGINSNALIEYPDNFQQTVPLRRSDLEQMAALGFNFLRLPVNWSRLEPQPDRFSKRYLDRIRQIVRWAEAEGISVLVDFHQDRYNKRLRPPDEADGAPEWATATDGMECTYGAFLTSPCSIAAYDHFWNNDAMAGKPLQTHYLEALIKVSRHLRDHRGLMGLELMNEPTFGSIGPPRFEREQLWPFNNRMIEGLREAGENRMIWFGPNVTRDALDFDTGRPERFSDDPDLVYAPHVYTGTFNDGGPDEMRASVAAAAEEARAYGAALVDAEWGGGTTEQAEALRALKLELQDEHRIGGAFWMWKQKPGFYDWHTVNPDGTLRSDSMRAQQLSQPHADRIPGQIASTVWTGSAQRTVKKGRGGTARLWSGTVIQSGGETLLKRPLIRAFVDGERVRPVLREKAFRAEGAAMRGFRVFLEVPAGTHEIVLRPGTPRWVKGHKTRHGWRSGHWR